jgi:FimV-like protein
MLNSSQVVFESAAAKVRSINRHHPVQPGAAHPGVRRLIAAALAASALSWSAWAAALGLGDITLRSALNQPLNAEIQLLETGGLSADEIVVRLAPPEAFAKAGIERVFFLNDLRFTSEVQGNRGVVRVVSTKAVTEPYLNFLVQLSRPNGDLLHEYTLLLDPATSPEGIAATRSRQPQAAAAAGQSRLPVAPPPAVQGKRYQVVTGDTLSSIARRVQAPDGKLSASQMADGIRALNPQALPEGSASLRAGQSLLLPDAAVVPGQAPGAPAAVQATELQRATEQLAASTLESQRLAQAVEELTARAQALQDEMAGKDKEITALRADLAQAQTPAAPPVAAAQAQEAPAAPPVAAPPAPASQDESFLSLPLLLAISALMLLLAAYVLGKRRQRRRLPEVSTLPNDDHLLKPAQAAVVPLHEVPAVAPQPAPATQAAQTPAKPVTSPRLAGASPDALDGVSIYVAYGRFNEALSILRNALETEPNREDIRIRILELLGEQGDVAGFAREEQNALDHGVERHKIDEIRGRYPRLKTSEPPAAVSAPAVAAAAPALADDPLPDLQLDETTAAALNPEPADEFQLNLDDLSMDADWDLVDPFDAPPARNKPVAPAAAPEVDPAFSSNLTELPEVFELSDEQFLSDFDASEPPSEKDEPLDMTDDDALSDEFLDSFMGDDSEFDLLDLDEAPLTQINQAQVLIDDGDFDAARDILNRVIEESDEQHRQMAKQMLANIG